jgi:hypothetical protein
MRIPALSYLGLAVSLLPLASSAQASGASLGQISDVIVSRSPQMMYFMQNTARTRAACATDDHWVFSVSTAADQALAALVLSASVSGKKVIVIGTGTCADVANYESVNMVSIP